MKINKEDNLENCPECGEDMPGGRSLCSRCQCQHDIENDSWGMPLFDDDYTSHGDVIIFWDRRDLTTPVQYKPMTSETTYDSELRNYVDPAPFMDTPFIGKDWPHYASEEMAYEVNEWHKKNKTSLE
ncbi:hypothetical protein [Xenorhabdus bovienii]|uniref:hypothetical protein n=1 Tax=Xenorhabdus bovienii TaxID=40576 RepID=UPI0023B28C70|nr:hypothetical protein [Xenorhabdus bovienii]MDE9487549.1 hypothetical protein [Xenorhabdus bovienii]